MNPALDPFFEKAKQWQPELLELRRLLAEFPELVEEKKWHQPCYCLEGKNVLIISGFKEYCALNFFKGALFQDPAGHLTQPGENTQSARQWRFTSLRQIQASQTEIRAYLAQAIAVERAGLEVDMKKTEDYAIPEELKEKFAQDPEFFEAFEALTPGRQRGYLLHFAQAKQSKTRTDRIEKHRARILQGKGLQDP